MTNTNAIEVLRQQISYFSKELTETKIWQVHSYLSNLDATILNHCTIAHQKLEAISCVGKEHDYNTVKEVGEDIKYLFLSFEKTLSQIEKYLPKVREQFNVEKDKVTNALLQLQEGK